MRQSIESSDTDKEIVSTRVVKFNRDLVFRAWSEPDHLKIWWGPAGFTNTFHEFDFRVGGKWTFTMHGPEKGNYENACEFTKIEKPDAIEWKRFSKPLFNVVAWFEESGPEQTKIIFKQVFETKEECDKIKKFVADKNEENFDRLEKVLESMK